MGWHYLRSPYQFPRVIQDSSCRGEVSERNMEVNLALATDMTHERAVERHNKTERNKSRNVSKVPLLFGLAQKCRISIELRRIISVCICSSSTDSRCHANTFAHIQDSHGDPSPFTPACQFQHHDFNHNSEDAGINHYVRYYFANRRYSEL